jgi:hypothetical protein
MPTISSRMCRTHAINWLLATFSGALADRTNNKTNVSK